MPTLFNKANIYTFLWCLYYLQGTLYPIGTIFSQLLLIVLISSSLYYVYYANKQYDLPLYFRGLNMFVILLSIYGVFRIVFPANDFVVFVTPFNYLKNIWISLLPLYAFYVFSKENLISNKSLLFWLVCFIGLCIALYYSEYQQRLLSAIEAGNDNKEFTNNVGYWFLSLIPLLVFINKKTFVQFIFFGVILFFIIKGMKRGAILISVICLIWFFWNTLQNVSVIKKIVIIVFSLLLCYIVYLFIQIQLTESSYFQKRVEQTQEGNTSGRDVLYSVFGYFFWNETTPFQYLFGLGADGTLKVFYNYAHSDWLEIAINQGVLGLILYGVYWIFFFITIVSKSFESHVRLALQLVFIISFMKTLFSMSYNDMTLPLIFILGYCLAQEKENEQVIYSD